MLSPQPDNVHYAIMSTIFYSLTGKFKLRSAKPAADVPVVEANNTLTVKE